MSKTLIISGDPGFPLVTLKKTGRVLPGAGRVFFDFAAFRRARVNVREFRLGPLRVTLHDASDAGTWKRYFRWGEAPDALAVRAALGPLRVAFTGVCE